MLKNGTPRSSAKLKVLIIYDKLSNPILLQKLKSLNVLSGWVPLILPNWCLSSVLDKFKHCPGTKYSLAADLIFLGKGDLMSQASVSFVHSTNDLSYCIRSNPQKKWWNDLVGAAIFV